MIRTIAVLAGLYLAASALADDKPGTKKGGPVTVVIDASKLPPEVLELLKKLATDKKPEGAKPDGSKKPGETKKPDGSKKPGETKKPDGDKKPGKSKKPDGDKKPDGGKTTDGDFNAATLGEAVSQAEKLGKSVVKAGLVEGVFVLGLADGSTLKILQSGGKKGDAPGRNKGDAPGGTKKGQPAPTKKGEPGKKKGENNENDNNDGKSRSGKKKAD